MARLRRRLSPFFLGVGATIATEGDSRPQWRRIVVNCYPREARTTCVAGAVLHDHDFAVETRAEHRNRFGRSPPGIANTTTELRSTASSTEARSATISSASCTSSSLSVERAPKVIAWPCAAHLRARFPTILPEPTSAIVVTDAAEPKDGIEPSTYALPRRCSTTELLGRVPIVADGRGMAAGRSAL